jgi:hypothetical protein
MQSTYDQNAWEQDTKLGRRLYIHNFGLKGTEFAGWELVKTSLGETSEEMSEKTYIFKHKKSKDEVLVQVRVVESSYWRNALSHLNEQLMQCMRPDIPRGKAKMAKIGDVQHVGETPNKETAAIFFTRGNLQISVSSVGMKPVDVTAFARSLDNRLTKPPTKSEEDKALATRKKPLKIKAKKRAMTVLIDALDEPVPRSGWTKVLVADGEVRKEGETLFLVDDRGGDRTVEITNYKLE